MHIQTFTGSDALPYIEDLGRLRITVFAEFPYLYNGDMAYEREYLQTFFEARQSVLVLAMHEDAIIGASAGLPLAEETDNIKRPFIERGIDVSKVFYFSESVLLPQWRGHGLGHVFMDERERWARANGYQMACFCAVVRPQDHPRCPANYRPLDDFWQKRGFQKAADMLCYIAWQDWDETQESEKPLQFWVKSL